MERKVDAGAVWARRKIDMHFPLRGADNYRRGLNELVKLFKEKWGDIYAGRIKPRKIAIQTIHTRAQTNAKRVLLWEQKASVGEILVNILANDFAPHCTSVLRVGE